MSAEVLREAARLMRERAEKATPGPWVESCIGSEGFRVYSNRPPTEAKRQARPVVASCTWEDFEMCGNDAIHIASWPPAVALAVADWLDFTARGLELAYEYGGGVPGADDHALTLARIYLTTTPHKEHTS